MPEGGKLTFKARIVKIETATKGNLTVLKPGHHLCLSVEDTGSGITPEVQEHIFEPFYTTKKTGSGFGLSNVAGIIKEHEGDIRVYSPPGKGTTFEMCLPFQEGFTAPAASEPSSLAIDGGGRLVLIVDDEVNIRNLLKNVLRRSNFQIVEAANGADALIKVNELRHRLHFIITDMHMPQLDGLGLIRNVKELLPALPIIVITGRLETSEREQLHEVGIAAIVEKPFLPQTILNVLR
jgi:CheY-like chemotaxis protein